MMKRIIGKLAAVLCLVLSPLAVHAQLMETHDRVASGGYDFWLYTPENVEEAKPLIIYLHGQSCCGTDLNMVRKYGTLDAIERGYMLDAYVLAPQNRKGRWNPKQIFDIVDTLQNTCNIDANRIYVVGMSLGGFGTVNVTAAYPDRVAAAMALCGGGNDPDYKALARVPLWILHGTADTQVPISDSRAVVQGIINAADGRRVKFTVLKGFDHSILARPFYMTQTYDWLFSHRLDDENRPLNTDYQITERDFTHAYGHLDKADAKNLKIVNRSKASTHK